MIWVNALPGIFPPLIRRKQMSSGKNSFFREEMTALYQEMEARETVEAKIYKALDNLEAVIQHNESDICFGH